MRVKFKILVIQQEFLEIGQYSKSLERDEKKFGCKEGRDHQLMNRYRDILPFDSTRVTLRNAPYINASWVNKKEYIARVSKSLLYTRRKLLVEN